MIDFAIDAAGATPPFEQMRTQVTDAVRDGRLVAGEKLPTVRALAERLGLAVNTVAKAYRALEEAGIIETHGRAGTLVAAGGDDTVRRAQAAAAAFAAEMHRLGLPPAEAEALVRAALAAAAG